ncbi:MAG: YceI family protein [Pseudomonadota bacterium]
MNILKSVFTFVFLMMLGNSIAAQQVFKTDQGHTELFFGWSHAGVSMQHGEFEKLEGTLDFNPKEIAKSSIQVSIDIGSLSSGYDALDKHLLGVSWLNVEKFPKAEFKSTSIEVTGKDTADITGDLTLHGVTKSVVLHTKLTHRGPHPVGKWFDYYKGNWLAFHATAKIDHLAFGIGSYSTGKITIEINTELKQM